MAETPQDSVDARRAWAILREACSMAHIPVSGGELVRLGENAVFWLASRTVVARVDRRVVRSGVAEREMKVARWLAEMAVPAVRPLAVPQPLRVEEHSVTFWESVGDEIGYGTPAELASLLRRLHALEPPADLDLPRADPLRRARFWLANATVLGEDERRFIDDLLEHLANSFTRWELPVRPVAIHGDANVYNVFRDRRGAPVLGDLGTVALGSYELDLVPAAVYHDRLGWHGSTEYREFTDNYGFDVRDWPGYGLAAQALEVEMITWLAQNAGHDVKAAQEVHKRIATIRTGGSRAVWKPFL